MNSQQWTTVGNQIYGYYTVGSGNKIHLAKIDPDKDSYFGKAVCGRRGLLVRLDQRSDRRMCRWCLELQSQALERIQAEIDGPPKPAWRTMPADFARCDGLIHQEVGATICPHRSTCLRFLSPLPTDSSIRANHIYITHLHDGTCDYHFTAEKKQ